MSLWDNVKKFAQPYSDDDYDDYDEDEEYEEYEEPQQPARRSRRTAAPAPAPEPEEDDDYGFGRRVPRRIRRRLRRGFFRQLRQPGSQCEQARRQAGGCAVPPQQLQRHHQGRG